MIGDTSLDGLIEETHYLVKEGFSYKDIHEMPLFEFDTHVDIMVMIKKKEANNSKSIENKGIE